MMKPHLNNCIYLILPVAAYVFTSVSLNTETENEKPARSWLMHNETEDFSTVFHHVALNLGLIRAQSLQNETQNGTDNFGNYLPQTEILPFVDGNQEDGSISPGCHFSPEMSKFLICDGSDLSVLPVFLPTQLLFFQLNVTQVVSIPYHAFYGKKISVMMFSCNNISEVSTRAFEGVMGVKYLSMRHTKINMFDYNMFLGLDDVQELILEDNHISLTGVGVNKSDIKNVLPKLQYLSLKGNPLDRMEAHIFWPLRSSPLEELNLQSCDLKFIHKVEDPQCLEYIPFEADYKPPPPPDANANKKREPEEIEHEMRAQEAELQKLILITIKLPDTALWFEPPQIVRWNTEKEYWSTAGFWDQKYNEDQCILQFRTSLFGTIALPQNRFSNLPFQSWELKPAGEQCVLFKLVAAVVSAEISIKEGEVCLNYLQNGSQNTLLNITGIYMKPRNLMKALRKYGVDLFPEYDSHCYIEGLSLKHGPTEDHLYSCMALASVVYNFTWSRWNLLAGAENLVLQFREISEKETQGSFSLLKVTPKKTAILECTEASQSYSSAEPPGMKFYANLHGLIGDRTTEAGKELIQNAAPSFIDAVYVMLSATKVLSYS